MAASVRRWGMTALAAAVGCLLLVCGIAVAVVDAQLRSDAATAAITLTAEQRQQLEEAGMADTVESDSGYFRRSLIMQNLSSGGVMPRHAFEIHEIEDGNVSISWGTGQDGFRVSSWGGWQLKPIGILSFAGIALVICAAFSLAARWESRHPPR